MKSRMEASWKKILGGEFNKEYFCTLTKKVQEAYASNIIFPPAELVFNAFGLCPFDKVKVVIIGQDPYHGPNQAQGLAFSVPEDIKIPPSLRNIYKEISEDLNIEISESVNLERWAKQGVLLLNATLTVEMAKPNSHQKFGWESFTDNITKTISDRKKNVVFILWGSYARSKANLIDKEKHLILEAPHPSPLSAHRGFFGCKHFSLTNKYLVDHKLKPIQW